MFKLTNAPSRLVRRWIFGFSALLVQMAAAHAVGTNPAEAQPNAAGTRPSLAWIAWGQALFFSKQLSADGSISCATCHEPDRAFTDGQAVSRGLSGRQGTRNAPSLFGAADQATFFWDGRRARLEEQVLDPFVNPVEHGLKSHGELLTKVRADAALMEKARKALPSKQLDMNAVRMALAAYVRSLEPQRSALDRYLFDGELQALSAQAVAGLALFRGRAGCVSCHAIGATKATLMDNQFHTAGVGLDRVNAKLPLLTTNVLRAKALAGLKPDGASNAADTAQAIDHAIVNDAELAELGRFLVTGNPKDIGKFKTPSLRNVALTAPYMHDGSMPTLEAAVDRELYYRGLQTAQPITLTVEEKNALLALLRVM